MIPHNAIANMIFDSIFDSQEEKKLRERDEIRRGKITLFRCSHNATLTHTNGDVECFRCHRIWKFKKEE